MNCNTIIPAKPTINNQSTSLDMIHYIGEIQLTENMISPNTHHITKEPGTEECIDWFRWLTNSFRLGICPKSNLTSILICK